MFETASSPVSQKSKNLALIAWIGTLLFGPIPVLGSVPSLVIYLIAKKDRSIDYFAQAHAEQALNWTLSFLVFWILGALFSMLLQPLVVMIMGAITIFGSIVCITGAIAVVLNKYFSPPFLVYRIK